MFKKNQLNNTQTPKLEYPQSFPNEEWWEFLQLDYPIVSSHCLCHDKPKGKIGHAHQYHDFKHNALKKVMTLFIHMVYPILPPRLQNMKS
jgi:hypothetical protein